MSIKGLAFWWNVGRLSIVCQWSVDKLLIKGLVSWPEGFTPKHTHIFHCGNPKECVALPCFDCKGMTNLHLLHPDYASSLKD